MANDDDTPSGEPAADGEPPERTAWFLTADASQEAICEVARQIVEQARRNRAWLAKEKRRRKKSGPGSGETG